MGRRRQTTIRKGMVMGAVKQAKIEGELFACDHFNVPEEQFIWMAADHFGVLTIQYQSAILEWNQIQKDLWEYDHELH
jgi:hypothetical protein